MAGVVNHRCVWMSHVGPIPGLQIFTTSMRCVPSLYQRRFLHVCAHLVWPVEVIDCSLVLVNFCLSGFTVCARTSTFRDFPASVTLLQTLTRRW